MVEKTPVHLVVLASSLLLALCAAGCPAAGQPAALVGAPTNLRCEYQAHPLALDTLTPRLSWELGDARRGAVQTAYRVLVGSNAADLAAEKADVWDSGVVSSAQSLNVVYAGPALQDGRAYCWRVRTWSRQAAVEGGPLAAPWSETSAFEVGFLKPQDWKARWVSAAPAPRPDLAQGWKYGNWIWHPTARGDTDSCWLRRTFEVADPGALKSAVIRCTADNLFTLFLNGERIGSGDAWERSYEFDVKARLRAGRNVAAVVATNQGGACGWRFSLRLTPTAGETTWVLGDAQWKASARQEAGWLGADFNDSAWVNALVLGPYGCAPWGAGGRGGPLRSMLLRKEFNLPAKPVRARVRVCGLGAYELRLNGEKVGADILAPGWTQFEKRVQYQTYDVTDQLRAGPNALGVVLGSGWWKGRIGGGRDNSARDSLRLILQLDAEGARSEPMQVLSDPSWTGHESPLLADDIYDGESYDARLLPPDWDQPGFKAEGWAAAGEVEQPLETLVPQPDEAIQALEDLPAKSVTEPRPGAYVFDFGQNLTGWVRLKVQGPAGVTLTLRHAEVLQPDGNIYTDNLRSARATDTYVLRGGGPETWEPRFTYHGFRYVEVTGWPGKPTPAALTARMISTAAPQIGSFQCSNDLVNAIQHNIEWGERGNTWSTPTDCPQRDERMGWTGDTQVFANTACWNEDLDRFFTKWMRDIRDCQSEDGAVTDVAPCGGGVASPAWGDVCIVVPYQVYRHYGDTRIIEENWDCMTRWVGYMTRNAPGHLYERNGYGDWIAPVGSPLHPISAAYCCYDCWLMADMATAIGKQAEADRYAALAAQIRDAFNARYFDPATNEYPGHTQTALDLPLFFNIAPADHRKAIAENLAKDIIARRLHLDTGFLGTGYLCPVLSRTGHHDLAWRLATQTTYPSWGYMVKQGATTIWELWDSDRAGPGMNSRNHFCLGSVGEWFYESLAGIGASGPVPVIYIRPLPVGDLRWVRGSVRSPYGLVVSNWELEADGLHMQVTIPPNTDGCIIVPTFGKKDVTITEGGQTIFAEGKDTGAVPRIRAGYLPRGLMVQVVVGAGHYDLVAKGVGLPPAPDYGLPGPAPAVSELRDDFPGDKVDAGKWLVTDMGLESDAPSGITAQVAGGALKFSGTTPVDYWAGRTLMSKGAFTVGKGQRLEVQVERTSLEAKGSGARSSLWLWVDPQSYVMFSQDTEKGHWSYNVDGRRGSGEELLRSTDPGRHVMGMVHDGSVVHLLLDGKEVGKVPVTWTEGLRVCLTGQARSAGDSLTATFRDLRAALVK